MPTAKKKMPDLDAKYAERIRANRAARKVYPFPMFGREWHATNGQSVVAIMDSVTDETGQGFIDLCLSMLVEEEQEAFHAELRQPGIDAEILLEILNDLMEIASGGRPTVPLPASSTTSRTTRPAGQSKAN